MKKHNSSPLKHCDVKLTTFICVLVLQHPTETIHIKDVQIFMLTNIPRVTVLHASHTHTVQVHFYFLISPHSIALFVLIIQ